MRKPPTAKGRPAPAKVFASQKINKPAVANKFESLVSRKRQEVQKALSSRKELVQEYRQLTNKNRIRDDRALEDPEYVKKITMKDYLPLAGPGIMKKGKKKTMFDLGSDDEVLKLTHKGVNIEDIDDFKREAIELNSDEEIGNIGGEIVDNFHFSGFYEPGQEKEGPNERRKTKQEIYTEIIHQSKKAKFQRQQAAMEAQMKLETVDDQFKDISHLLMGDVKQFKEDAKKMKRDDDYYSMAADLQYDRKVVPEVTINEDGRRREKRENEKREAKLQADKADQEDEYEEEENVNDDAGDVLSNMGDDEEVDVKTKLRKGKINHILRAEKNQKNRVKFIDDIRKMKTVGDDDSDSMDYDESDDEDDDELGGGDDDEDNLEIDEDDDEEGEDGEDGEGEDEDDDDEEDA